MRNLMCQIAISLGLTLMMATLVVVSPDKAQAKAKKQTGNSAKVKSQAKRVGVRNSDGQAKIQISSSGRNAKGSSMIDVLVSGAKSKSNAQLKAGSSEVLYEKVSGADIVVGHGTTNLQNAEKVRSQAERKKVAGAESFSIDIGTSENLRSQVGSARRKTTKHKR